MALPAVFHTYRAVVRYVIDGDTVAVDVDCGFHVWVRLSCRLVGIDAPESDTIAGKASKAALVTLLPAGTAVVVDSVGVDKYGGRFDAKVYTPAGGDIGAAQVRSGNAVPWKTGTPKPYQSAR